MLLARFYRDCAGNIAPIFVVALIPMIGLVGTAVDYTRASSIRSAMQGGLDATALMLSKEATGLTLEQLQTKATTYFQATFNRPEAKDVVITPVYSSDAGNYTIKVSSTGAVDTTFTRVLGLSKIDLGSSSEVTWGIKKLELALALDNTGSMASSNKMTELKKAAKSLLDTLYKSAKKADDVRIAIIPFATDVNVKDSLDAKYIRWTEWEGKNGTCSNNNYSSKNGCTSNGHTWTPADHASWNGCVWDRDKDPSIDLDAKDTAPDVNFSNTLFSAHQASNCPVGILPLTDVLSGWNLADPDSSTLGAKVKAMTPAGNTNVTIGLVWGWHALTQNAPLEQASAVKPDLDKVIILLTDGDNTENRYSTSESSINARTTKACDNIRTANIKVYTIRVINGNATLLKNCATKTDMYYDVQNASQLNTVFKAISENLASLRISK